MKRIILFDPALQNNEGAFSSNLGDCIISESTNKYLREIFGLDAEICRYSTHFPLSKEIRSSLKDSDYCFIGGSNLLSSKILKYNQWKLIPNPTILDYIFPSVKKMILFGVGWWQYQKSPDLITQRFYNEILDKNFIHSVRDNYTLNQLDKLGTSKIINTSCPTTWDINGKSADRTHLENKEVLLTLTDYNTNTLLDSDLLKLLLKHYSLIYFFPQGNDDLLYLKTLEIFKNNKNRFAIVEESISSFEAITSEKKIDYIGTRLHGGIKCIQKNIQTLIIGIDNRAVEMHKDINIPVFKRDALFKVEDWILGKTSIGKIEIDLDAINNWKNQFLNI